MQFYKLTINESDDRPDYLCTRDEAHKVAKKPPNYTWPDIRIELVEIATDKDTLAEILSRQIIPELILRTWRLTPRGGLVEGPNGV